MKYFEHLTMAPSSTASRIKPLAKRLNFIGLKKKKKGNIMKSALSDI